MSKEEKDPVKKKKKKKKKQWGAPVVKKGADYYKATGKIYNYENWSDANALVWDVKDTSGTLYITKCNKTSITVKQKVTRVCLLKCTDCVLNCPETVINKIEVTSSRGVQIKVDKHAPIIQVSKCGNTKVSMSRFGAMGTDDKVQCDVLTEESTGTVVSVDGKETTFPNQVASTWDKELSFKHCLNDEFKAVTAWEVPDEKEESYGKDGVYLNYGSAELKAEGDKIYVGKSKGTSITVAGNCNVLTIADSEKVRVDVKGECKLIEFVNCKNCKAETVAKIGSLHVSGSDSTAVSFTPKAAGEGGDALVVLTDTSCHTNLTIRASEESEKETGVPEQIHSKFNGTDKWELSVEEK